MSRAESNQHKEDLGRKRGADSEDEQGFSDGEEDAELAELAHARKRKSQQEDFDISYAMRSSLGSRSFSGGAESNFLGMLQSVGEGADEGEKPKAPTVKPQPKKEEELRRPLAGINKGDERKR